MDYYSGLPSSPKRRRLSACSKTMASGDANTKASFWLFDFRLDDLTDDELIEIFLKLPVKSLYRFKCVSKRWFSLIFAPSFARSYIVTLHHSSSPPPPMITKLLLFEYTLAGFREICGLPLDDVNIAVPSLLPLSFDFVPALRRDRYNYHYGVRPTGVVERVLVGVHLKGICSGLVLLQAKFQDSTDTAPYYKNPTYGIFYVCNPPTKHWMQLPLLASTAGRVGFTCYYLRQEGHRQVGKTMRVWANSGSTDELIKQIPNYNPNNIEFTAVFVTKDEKQDVFIIFVFHSCCETANWSEFWVPFPSGYVWAGANKMMSVMFSNGVFLWDGINSIAAYDPFKNPDRCNIIPLPPLDYPEINHPVLDRFMATTCEGRLRMGTDFSTGRFVVWELVDYANKVWALKYDINVRDLSHYCFDFNVCFQSFAGAAGDKAYFVDDKNLCIMLFDLSNGSIQPVYSVPREKGVKYLFNIEPCLLSPWPTRMPLRQEA